MRLEQKADAEEVLRSMARRQLSCLHPEGLLVLLGLVVEIVVADFKMVGVCTEVRTLVLTEELEWTTVEINTDISDEEPLATLAVTDMDIELALPRIGSTVNTSLPEEVIEGEDLEEGVPVRIDVGLLMEEDLTVISIANEMY